MLRTIKAMFEGEEACFSFCAEIFGALCGAVVNAVLRSIIG